MLMTTTPTIENHKITKYLGLVCGEVIIGAHMGKDFLAGITNLVGGRSDAYETTIRETRDGAIAEMLEEAKAAGGNAIVGVKFDYQVIGQSGSMMMVAVCGTAVVAE